MRIYTRVMAVGVTQEIDARGAFVRGITGTAVYDLEAVTRTGESLGVLADFQTCLAVEFKNADGSYKFFDKLRITSATVQTISVVVHDSFVDDNRLTGIVNITGGISAKSIAPETVTLPGSGTIAVTNAATLVLAAGTKRGKVILQNTSANPIAIGFSNAVTFAAGILLEPVGAGANAGGSIELDTNTAIYAIAAVAGPSVLRAIANEYT